MDRLPPFAFRLIVVSLLLLSLDVAASGETTGRLEIFELQSKVFGNTRNIRVWLPFADDEADAREHRYPVLYLNDGQDLFDASESLYFSSAWTVDQRILPLINAGQIEPIIVVGIDNAGRRGRAREYLPYPDIYLTPPEPGPSGSLYASFLESEVIPLIESRYPVRTDKEGRTLGGSSYGGLIALYVAATRPALFGQLLLESPSLYVDDNRVLREVEQAGLSVGRVYLGAGTNEIGSDTCGTQDAYFAVVKGILDLSNILIATGLPADRIRVNVEPCATHTPAAWSRRLPAAATFLYGNQIVSTTSRDTDPDQD